MEISFEWDNEIDTKVMELLLKFNQNQYEAQRCRGILRNRRSGEWSTVHHENISFTNVELQHRCRPPNLSLFWELSNFNPKRAAGVNLALCGFSKNVFFREVVKPCLISFLIISLKLLKSFRRYEDFLFQHKLFRIFWHSFVI